jgi:type IV pilus assembly protein PilB
MIDLGTPPFMLSSALIGILSQRLVRKLCKKCRKRVRPSAETLRKLKIDADAVRYLYRAYDAAEDAPKKNEEDDEGDEDDKPQVKVCSACGGTGYTKRTGIFDLLVVNEKISDLIKANPNVQEIRQVAVNAGLKTLFEDGARLVIDGETSIQELLRVSR